MQIMQHGVEKSTYQIAKTKIMKNIKYVVDVVSFCYVYSVWGLGKKTLL